jgi:hypothetical protein
MPPADKLQRQQYDVGPHTRLVVSTVLDPDEDAPRPADAAPHSVYDRPQLQPVPHWQIAPQRHPGRRVSVFFLDI